MAQRIDYIDYLKGLSIIWVVWYHTVHPWFVDFSFRIPLFFLASGIFFKVVDVKTYILKKTNQLIIPFIFFSLLYYIYLITQTFIANGSLSSFDFACIFGIFKTHTGNESFVVDPPLWFISALLCQQIMTMILVKTLRKRWIILLAALGLTIFGVTYLWYKPTLFMFGRSLPYLIYYVSGHLYGKDLLKIVESKSLISYAPCIGATALFFISIILKNFTSLNTTIINYLETFGLIIMLVYFFKGIYRFRIAYPFWFYGRNSYIVLGVHEIYQTIFLVLILHFLGEINIWIGMVQTLLSLLLLWPTINILNKYLPELVGKRPGLNLQSMFRKQ